jgi:hypothetical protein
MRLKHLPIFLFLLLFFIIKATNLGVRLSDTNIYFDVAYQISQGKLIYRDFFYSNFPLFAFISTLYYFLVGKNIEFFYITSTLEVITITALIYYISFKKTKSILVSFISSAIYAFSFIVLSTSDHQTGVFTASLFAVIGYLFLYRKKILLSGIFVALSFFTKAYFIPIVASFFIYLFLQKNNKNTFRFIYSFIITGLIIIIPFLIFAQKEFINDIFRFSLTRPAGILKSDVAWFFITKDFLLFVLLIFNIFNFRKNIFFTLVSFFSIILFFLFQDVYYLYLNFFIPFLALSFYEFHFFWIEKLKLQKMIIPSVVIILLIISSYNYFSRYRDLQKINDFNKIIKVVISEHPKYLYGVDDITPALLNETGIAPLENVRDAHEYFFSRKILNKDLLTNKAIKSKSIVISHGVFYPELNINEQIVDGIFNKKLILKSCKLLYSTPVKSEGIVNRINVFKCF